MGPADNFHDFIDTLSKATLHPDSLNGLDAANDIGAAVLLLHRVHCPRGHGLRQQNRKFGIGYLMKPVMVQGDKLLRMIINKFKMVAQHLFWTHTLNLSCVLLTQFVQPEVNHSLLKLKIAIKSLTANGSLFTDFRNRNLLKRLALHVGEQCICDHMLTLDSCFVDLLLIHN